MEGGDGGDGIISFDRPPGKRKGRPEGGKGGAGGDVYIEADTGVSTLLKFENEQFFKGEDGVKGGPKKQRGGAGEDSVITVPVGTSIYDLEQNQLIADLTKDGQRLLIAEGGAGGRGNNHFTNATRQSPRIREWGESGESRRLKLELKILADVGIVGFPNVGKSSLISAISAQHPKIDNYHFTTLDPHPGVVKVSDWEDFVAVDIPGIIEGAHSGKGLGNEFLRHLDRCKMLLHLIDLSGVEGRDPVEDWRVLRREISDFSSSLTEKTEIVVGNKIDLMGQQELSKAVERFERKTGVEVFPISAVKQKNLGELVRRVYSQLKQLGRAGERRTSVSEQEEGGKAVYKFSGETGFRVMKSGDKFLVVGEEIERMARMLDLSTEDAIDYFYHQLERKGVVNRLEQKGASDGSIIEIGGKQFEFVT